MSKCAIVTGGSRGIGAAVALALAEEGYDLAITYNERTDCAEDVVSRAKRLGASAVSFKADVKSYDGAVNVVDSVMRRFKQIDILVNNAAISSTALFTDVSPEDWNKIISTNLTGCYNYCRTVLPHMIRRHKGCIINISSMWGQIGASCEVAYSAAKAGVIGLTKALAKEVSLSGIRVNAIAPGVIKTDMLGEYTEEELEALKEETPIQRLGSPEDIANAAVFLAGERASFITGQVLGVNGGFVI